MYLIVGLGNPGTQYRFNRHNIGFLAIDSLHGTYGITEFQKNKWNGLMAEGQIAGIKVMFLKPQTYMNLSGPAVSGVANFYKIPLSNIIVIHDDLDLAPGDLRMKTGGGNGGHNGLKSLDTHMGKDYWRLRIGIGHPGIKDMVSGYVLGNFSPQELSVFDELLANIRDHIDLLIQGADLTPAPFLQKIKG